MAEHTPDTEEVAFCYEGQDMDAGERRAGFERWLVAAQERAERATEGPWATDVATGDEGQIVVYGQPVDDDYPDERALIDGDVLSQPDAEFIAHARTEHPAMVAALKAVLDLLDTVDDEGEISTHADGVHVPVYLVRTAITDHLPMTAPSRPRH